MKVEKILIEGQIYYFSKDALDESKVQAIYIFEDDKLQNVCKDEKGFPRNIIKSDIVEDLREWGGGGAGYAVYGGGWGRNFGNPSGKFAGRGFGFGQSSSNLGGANLMYTYSIVDLNQNLQQGPSAPQDNGQYIHSGTEVKGKILGKDKWLECKILGVEQDNEGNISCYTAIDQKTGRKIKLDPTSIEVIKRDDTPNMAVRDLTKESFYPNFEEFMNESD